MDLPQEHNSTMQAMCRLRPDENLPDKLVEKYWAFKRCMDRVGAALQPSDLARMCVECGYGKPLPTDNPKPTVADLYRRKEIGAGQEVVVEWRGKKTNGQLLRVTSANELVVVLEGDPQERRFSVDRVELAA